MFRQQWELQELQKRHRKEIEAFRQQVSTNVAAPLEANSTSVTPVNDGISFVPTFYHQNVVEQNLSKVVN